MTGERKTYTLRFRHDVFEGTPHDAGLWQGEQMAGDDWRGSFSGKPPFLDFHTPVEAERALRTAERHCPGIEEEVRGASEASGVPVEQMTALGGCVNVGGRRFPTLYPIDESPSVPAADGGCSHFVLPRHLTPDRHLRMGVNYDCHPEMQELRLCTTRIEGKAAHISFSDSVFGRTSGINERGFAITSSLGSPLSKVRIAGLPYHMVSRILLDQCASVAEAIDQLKLLPIAWYSNYLLADRSGETAQVEIACDKLAIRRFAPDEARALWATNHYTLPEMVEFVPLRMKQSLRRWEFLRSQLETASSPIDRLHDLLSAPYPDGLRVSHYLDGLGTLESMVLDLDALTADVCFGPADRNPWYTIGLDQPVGTTIYEVTIENVPAPRGFWARAG